MIKKYDNRLVEELNNFWKWSTITKENYENNSNHGEWEYYYPHWDRLLPKAYDLIDKIENYICKDSFNVLLETIAIDNEGEDVANYCLEKMSNKCFSELIKQGVNYEFSNTRWQIAELLGKRDVSNSIFFIEKLLNDKDSYVIQRALISCFKVELRLAERYANRFTKSNNKNLRRISIKLIDEYLCDKHEH